MVEDGYEFFAKRQLVTLFSAPNYCGEFDNAGAMMSVDETLMCSFQVSLHHACVSWICITVDMSLTLTVTVMVSVSCSEVSAHLRSVTVNYFKKPKCMNVGWLMT